MKVYMYGRKTNYYAQGDYYPDKFIVKKGSTINPTFTAHVYGGSTALRYRNDRSYVNDKGEVLKDCRFDSPSSAALFVCGYSVNGLLAWHTSKGLCIKDYLCNNNNQ